MGEADGLSSAAASERSRMARLLQIFQKFQKEFRGEVVSLFDMLLCEELQSPSTPLKKRVSTCDARFLDLVEVLCEKVGPPPTRLLSWIRTVSEIEQLEEFERATTEDFNDLCEDLKITSGLLQLDQCWEQSCASKDSLAPPPLKTTPSQLVRSQTVELWRLEKDYYTSLVAQLKHEEAARELALDKQKQAVAAAVAELTCLVQAGQQVYAASKAWASRPAPVGTLMDCSPD
eukprot:jgi/Chlat1/1646/Chrsp127S01898